MGCCCFQTALKSIDVLSCVSPLPTGDGLCTLLLIALPTPSLDALRHNLDDEAVALRQLAFSILHVFILQQQQGPLMFRATFRTLAVPCINT